MSNSDFSTKDDIYFDLLPFLSYLYQRLLRIICISVLIGLISIFYALSVPNKYTSDAVLKIVENQASPSSSIASSLGSLGSIAGLSLGNQSNNASLAIQTINSRDFFSDLTDETKNSNFIFLTALNKFDFKNNKFIFNDTIYDSENKVWLSDDGKNLKPTFLEAYKIYSDSLNITKNKESGYLYISFEHFSPFFARDFLDQVITLLDLTIRSNDLKDSNDRLDYLIEASKTESNSDLKNSITQLIYLEHKKQVSANVSRSYFVEVIDSPHLPEKKSFPRRSIICIVITIFGVGIMLLFDLIRFIISTRQALGN